MSTAIDKHEVLLFIQKKVGRQLDSREAKNLGLEKKFNEITEESGDETIKAEDILEVDDLYAKFATLCQDEKEKDNIESEDKKKENKVKDKNQAKA